MLRAAFAVAALLAATPADHPRARSAKAPAVARPAVAPATLTRALERIGTRFDGDVGIAVLHVWDGWLSGFRAERRYPQQSVVKLWVALAALDAVDRGALALDTPVTVRPGDLSLFHQPMADLVGSAGYRTDLAGLVRAAAVDSDNLANDLLVRMLGGPSAVQAILSAKGLDGIRVDREERVMQSDLSGVKWRPDFARPGVFDAARAALPEAARVVARRRYLADPRDTATPVGSVEGLRALLAGRLLSRSSTARLLGHMADVVRASDRLKAGVPAGWRVAHRPGTGPTLLGGGIATNDIGLLVAPDGQTFAVAVFIAHSARPPAELASAIASVARAVVSSWRPRR